MTTRHHAPFALLQTLLEGPPGTPLARAFTRRLAQLLDGRHGYSEAQVEALRRVDVLVDEVLDEAVLEGERSGAAAADHPTWRAIRAQALRARQAFEV